MVVEIPSNFIGDFKVGDNLVYNTGVLRSLCEHNGDGSLNKLVVVQVGSILEAALGQIIYRAQNFNQEGVPNIVEADRQEIEGRKIDKLNNIIDVMRKYDLLNELGGGIYDELHTLRKFRNKVHIQDTNEGVPPDEEAAFTSARCVWSLELCATVLGFLSQKFPRPADVC
ncbi:hypothetical protein [Sinorhizobium medicae]|uniref:hypothetical protein n=1 Tax=Sinorhizobium medicae TaxID=110321 RepID=UPI000FD9AF21|nr:hypothetical protein [Sinorhizobium medicae]RVP48897.1 hypothetical protein CN078_24155 [Sinorhizobium medicae]RVP73685.1 hypothetical protein CN079_23905 [Sinorhizobium medicae]UWU12431.1 hypothetical protein N2598_30345 [Sinorhizobium medicae]